MSKPFGNRHRVNAVAKEKYENVSDEAADDFSAYLRSSDEFGIYIRRIPINSALNNFGALRFIYVKYPALHPHKIAGKR